MVPDNSILIFALLFYLIDFSAILMRRFRFGFCSLIAAVLLSIATSFAFLWSFVTDNFVLRAVYEQSSRSLSPLLKLSASWTGAGGSLLLWSFIMSMVVFAFRMKNRHSMNVDKIVASMTQDFFAMTIIGFALATNPFSELPVNVPDGLGQNPSLQTFLSAIHPPLIFAAYSTLLLSYSLVLGSRWAERTDTRSFNERIIWIAWTLLTLGISLGGFWAYHTLGWGGYWVWDPLETSALVTWLPLTAMLFARLMDHSKHYDLFAVTFSASSLFVTVYIARSAVVASVHGYGNLVGGGAILGLAIVPILLSLMAARRDQTSQIDTGNAGTPVILTFWSLMLIASADLSFLLWQSLGPAFGLALHPSSQLYNYASFPMVVVFLSAILVGCIKERPNDRHLIYSFVFLFAMAFLLSLLRYPSGSVLLDFGLPFVFALLGGTAYRVLKWIVKSRGRFYPFLDVKYVAFLGLAILLLGVFVSSSMEVSATETVAVGKSFTALGSEFSVVQIATIPSANRIFLPPYGMVPESIDSRISCTLGDQSSGTVVLLLRYYPARDQFVPTPSIQSSLGGDTYIVASATDSIRQATAVAFRNRTSTAPIDVKITVTKIPAVSLVWAGVVILVTANLPFVLSAGASTDRFKNSQLVGNGSV
jgi:cytochrome c biogenesis factor